MPAPISLQSSCLRPFLRHLSWIPLECPRVLSSGPSRHSHAPQPPVGPPLDSKIPQPHILTDTFVFLIRYLWTEDLDGGSIPSTDALGKAATRAIIASSR
eukprot:scaffold350_cov333-Pavlova_lutheri.AAC.26